MCGLRRTLCLTMNPRRPFFDSEVVGAFGFGACMLKVVTTCWVKVCVVVRLTILWGVSCRCAVLASRVPLARSTLGMVVRFSWLLGVVRRFVCCCGLGFSVDRLMFDKRMALGCLVALFERVVTSLLRLPLVMLLTFRTLFVCIVKFMLCRVAFVRFGVEASLCIISIVLFVRCLS